MYLERGRNREDLISPFASSSRQRNFPHLEYFTTVDLPLDNTHTMQTLPKRLYKGTFLDAVECF